MAVLKQVELNRDEYDDILRGMVETHYKVMGHEALPSERVAADREPALGSQHGFEPRIADLESR